MSTDTAKLAINTKKVTPNITDKKYLCGGHFLVERTDPSNIFIPEEFNEEQLMIKEMVVDFCMKNVQEPFFKRGRELEIVRPEDRDEIIGNFKQAGELGLCGVSIPEEYGGMGLDFNTGVLFSEAIAAGFSFATTIGAQTSIGSLPIVYYGNEAQKQKYLPGIASGELVASYALTEPTAGSDANSGRTSATPTADGKHYLLNGQKIWITNGGFADIFVVFAKIGKDKDLSAFIVEKDYEGFSIGPEEKKMGIKASSTVQIYFDNCRVPAENLLGNREAGFKMALNILNTGRIKLAAGAMGGAKLALTLGVKYALQRKQFEKSISEFGAIQYKVGDIAAKAFAIESAVYRTGQNIDYKSQVFINQGLNKSEATLNAIREFAIECSILKVKGSNLACYATDESMQIHGGMGYAAETGLEMAYRDARITKIYEGTNDVNQMLSVGELFKRGMQTKEIDLQKAGKSIPKFIVNQILGLNGSSKKWGAEMRIVQALKNTFLVISGAAGKKLKTKLIDEQEIILNLADILAEAYVAESVILRLQKLATMPNLDAKKYEAQAKAQLYLYEAVDIAQKAAKDAIGSFAKESEKKRLNYAVRKMLKPADWNAKELRRDVAKYVFAQGEYAL
jgi:alkylation response protein AidB-like acyl-CoA dehydrogenase